jgi:transposase
MVLSIEGRVFLVEYVFGEGNRYTDLVQEQFAEKFSETPVPHRNAVRRLIAKFRETVSELDKERGGRPSKLNYKKLMDTSGLYRRSWTSLPTPFISAQRLSERTIFMPFQVGNKALNFTS